MKICQKHWDELRRLISENGLSSFVAQSGQAAMQNMVAEFEGKESPPDPLMMANMMIMERAIKEFGLGVMFGENCPLCHANDITPPDHPQGGLGDYWVATLIPHIKNRFQEKGLLNRN